MIDKNNINAKKLKISSEVTIFIQAFKEPIIIMKDSNKRERRTLFFLHFLNQ